MENLKEYKEALKQAKSLPTHINGELQEHYHYYVAEPGIKMAMYSEEPTPVAVFNKMPKQKSGAERFYTKTLPTYREDGNMLPKKYWEEKLFFHKKWARQDNEVKGVKFEVVGIKRQTTQMPAGVLIKNVEFIMD